MDCKYDRDKINLKREAKAKISCIDAAAATVADVAASSGV